MWNTAVGIKNCKQIFSRWLAFTTEKKSNAYSRDDVRTMCWYFLGRQCKQCGKKFFTVFDTELCNPSDVEIFSKCACVNSVSIDRLRHRHVTLSSRPAGRCCDARLYKGEILPMDFFSHDLNIHEISPLLGSLALQGRRPTWSADRYCSHADNQSHQG